MSASDDLKAEVQRLYYEPIIGANYTNTYGEENILNLVNAYRKLSETEARQMLDILGEFSTSTDLTTSYVSVGVLHALGQHQLVGKAYEWANTQDDAQQFTHHFDIGVSLADHFID